MGGKSWHGATAGQGPLRPNAEVSAPLSMHPHFRPSAAITGFYAIADSQCHP